MRFVVEEPRANRMWILDKDISEQMAHGLKLMFDTYYDMKDLKIFKTSIVKKIDDPSLHYHLREGFIDEVKERLKFMMQKER